MNVPVCVVALVLAWRGLEADSTARTAYRLDLIGLALISPALAAGIFGLSQVAVAGGFARTEVVVPLALFVALMAAFVVRTLQTPAVPVIDLRLFRLRSFGAASALLILSGLSLYGAMLLLPLRGSGACSCVAGWAG